MTSDAHWPEMVTNEKAEASVLESPFGVKFWTGIIQHQSNDKMDENKAAVMIEEREWDFVKTDISNERLICFTGKLLKICPL